MTAHEQEYVGVFGRAIVRFGGSFHSVVWRAIDGEVGAKLYPAYEPLSDEAAFRAAQRFVHDGVRPGEGSRSFRTPTLRGLMPATCSQACHVIAVEELRAVEQGREW
jgi:hypothetical protein